MELLQRGDLVPHFAVTRTDGSRWDYGTIWQRKNLVLVTLPADDPSADRYEAELKAHAGDWESMDAVCVVTRDALPGVPAPGVLVADRWGEVYFAAHASETSQLPAAGEILEWLRTVDNECPECQGEAL